MGLFVRKAQPTQQAATRGTKQIDRADSSTDPAITGTPTARALECLAAAATVKPDSEAIIIEERAVWQPDSWLLQRCWHELAETGAGAAALEIAGLLENRNPLTRVQALYLVARHARHAPDTLRLVAQEVRQVTVALFRPDAAESVFKFSDQLLYAGAAAAQLGNIALACACLERLDQMDRPWDRLYIPLDTRAVLAETVVRIGLHPLTHHLLNIAIRRYEEPGAQFLHHIMQLAATRLNSLPVHGKGGTALGPRRVARRLGRLMQRCAEVYQFSTLSTLNTRRLAATAFGRLGKVHDVLEQVETIATVQAARQETGLGGSRGDPHFLRQVTRPTANLDVDFQVYTLQEAIRAMPLRTIPREERIVLANRVAALATQSDGWTAAGAVATLVELGALRYAVRVMDYIPPADATRSEGVISLVRALLSFKEHQLAHEQVQKAITWARNLPNRNPERALIWGLAEVYMEFDQPQRAIELLDLRVARAEAEATFGTRLRRLFRNAPNDDELRDNRLRLRALIQQDRQHTVQPATAPADDLPPDPDLPASPVLANAPANAPKAMLAAQFDPAQFWNREKESLYRQLRQWAPRLLDGEALINFYVEGLLRPLFMAGQIDLIIQLLPQISTALRTSTGDKHTVHIRKVTTLLAQAIDPQIVLAAGTATRSGALLANDAPAPQLDMPPLASAAFDELHGACIDFLAQLWAADAQRGIWQMVHSLEGSLPLLLALEGPHALVAIAHHAAETGQTWAN